ncbi:Hypothetical predicted protein, partial [Marmota monax]
MDTAITQSPALLAVYPGERTTITCTTNLKEKSKFSWYQQKPGQPPKLLVHGTSTLASGVLAQFSFSHSGPNFTLTISNMETNDAGTYYCVEWPGDHSDTSPNKNPHSCGEQWHLMIYEAQGPGCDCCSSEPLCLFCHLQKHLQMVPNDPALLFQRKVVELGDVPGGFQEE